MVALVTIIHIIICLFLVLTILLQAGKGAGMGFLGGASSTVFGGRGATTFLGKLTAVMASLFILTSIFLAWHASQQDDRELKERADSTLIDKKEETERTGTKPTADEEESEQKEGNRQKEDAGRENQGPGGEGRDLKEPED